MTRTSLGWQALRWPGLEHVILTAGPAGYTAAGQLVLACPGLASVRYRLRCDVGWRFRELDITVTSAAGERTRTVSTDGHGNWKSCGRPLAELTGCTDIDLGCTPLTNTLPIRRLAWAPGTAYDLDVVYVTVPGLEITAARQRYMLLRDGGRDGERLFRYESGLFRADLRTDSGGCVIDYPGVWRRIGTSEGASG